MSRTRKSPCENMTQFFGSFFQNQTQQLRRTFEFFKPFVAIYSDYLPKKQDFPFPPSKNPAELALQLLNTGNLVANTISSPEMLIQFAIKTILLNRLRRYKQNPNPIIPEQHYLVPNIMMSLREEKHNNVTFNIAENDLALEAQYQMQYWVIFHLMKYPQYTERQPMRPSLQIELIDNSNEEALNEEKALNEGRPRI